MPDKWIADLVCPDVRRSEGHRRQNHADEYDYNA